MTPAHPHPNHLDPGDGGSMFLRNVGVPPARLNGATIHMTVFELKWSSYSKTNSNVLLLCLIKYHAVKTWGSGGIAPRIPNLGT
jgi:hypothetical protein